MSPVDEDKEFFCFEGEEEDVRFGKVGGGEGFGAGRRRVGNSGWTRLGQLFFSYFFQVSCYGEKILEF